MIAYLNTSEAWGAAIPATMDDFRKCATIFGLDPDDITADEQHVYYCGEAIADREWGVEL